MRLQGKVEIENQRKANSEKHESYKFCAALRITETVLYTTSTDLKE